MKDVLLGALEGGDPPARLISLGKLTSAPARDTRARGARSRLGVAASGAGAAMLGFEWDRRKARSNEKKHGVSLEEATTVFGDPLSP